ncbi:MAG: DUF116 domain-containing protein [Candidatus Bathyarchaeota archaeon]|jgi:hypothetical protein|nr:DUF116 domain-containing protein [Candidatus Bathyarchaeota archaeon A05DMB-3]MDH7606246.1 DUF116 domain-containing protein [Candidatus Bathyarchaeota archaeon]
MPYKFTFDLSRIPRFFFTEIAKISYEKRMHRKVGNTMQDIIRKFRIEEMTGLNLSDAVQLLEDLVDMEARNFLERKKFRKTRKRALFLPHCSRKFMDNRCKAKFEQDIPSYVCAHCSPDCLINRAASVAEMKGYDVYILPGGSCISKILKLKHYEGVVGVACGEELRLAGEALYQMNVAGQAIPLLKNGCANTFFNIETLFKIL